MKIDADFNNGEWIAGPFKCFSERYNNTVWFGQLIDTKASPRDAMKLIEASREDTLDANRRQKEELVRESMQYLVPGYASHSIADVIIYPKRCNSVLEAALTVFQVMCDPRCTVLYNNIDDIVDHIHSFSSVLILAETPVNHMLIGKVEELVHSISPLARIGIFTFLAQETDLK